ncbi:MAG: CPBP family intramembrane metalloprotease [Clostridia bacterium]|nr:CPBP family intramembrane metalloprotease [Clostridia bacterium]
MNKLYVKSELCFSLVFIVLYIVGVSVCDMFSGMIGISNIFTLPFLLGLSLILFFWIKNNDLLKKYGLCKPNFSSKHFLFYIPLLFLISTNLLLGINLNLKFFDCVLSVLTMLCVGFVEEIIFRGFLFKALAKDNVKSAIIVSSVTFGLGHLVNLFSSGLDNLVPNVCQVFYAMAVGFLFVIMFHRGGSLIACIITHSLVNMLSIFQNTQKLTMTFEIGTSIAIIVISIIYAIVLLKTLKENNQIIEQNIDE